ncbi:MAG: hypothetical protein KKG75_01165 [Nanoarchaeota archaeon]|nr:hypothetical protein [Nanoarchaeota archaeon]
MASVQQKVNAIKEKCSEIDSGTRKIERETNALANEIKAYIKNFYFGEA